MSSSTSLSDTFSSGFPSAVVIMLHPVCLACLGLGSAQPLPQECLARKECHLHNGTVVLMGKDEGPSGLSLDMVGTSMFVKHTVSVLLIQEVVEASWRRQYSN